MYLRGCLWYLRRRPEEMSITSLAVSHVYTRIIIIIIIVTATRSIETKKRTENKKKKPIPSTPVIIPCRNPVARGLAIEPMGRVPICAYTPYIYTDIYQ
jgi:hypothetical protein